MTIKVLAIDDSRTIRSLVQKVMEDAGFDCVCAEDGVDGIARFAEVTPDVVITDINMPNMDGLTLLSRLKSDFPGEDFSVLMLTAQSAPEDIKRAVQLGAKDYIGKPFEPRQLLRRLDRITRS